MKLYQNNQIDELNAAFAVIEKLHLEGDPFVKEAATIGILEGIQNIAGNTGMDPEAFVSFLGPESRVWWKYLNDFWNKI